MLNVCIGSDHAGYDLKKNIIKNITKYNILDKGCDSSEKSVDYPDYAHIVAKEIMNQNCHFGILICQTGIGMSIAANKHNNIRAALCHNLETASLAKRHNNANILCIGAKFINLKEAIGIIETFLQTDFEEGRHLSRIKKIQIYN